MVVEEDKLIKCGYCNNTSKHIMWSYPEGSKKPGIEIEVECMSGSTVESLKEDLEYYLHMMIRCKQDRKFDPKNPLKNTCIGCQADRDLIRNIIVHLILEAEKCYHKPEDFM